MTDNYISSIEIIKHNKFSWSYYYILNGKKRDIHGSSLHELKRKVDERGLSWDSENYPDEKISKTKYDSMKLTYSSKRGSSSQYCDETYDYMESQTLRGWTPSSKKWNRKRDIRRFYD